MNTEHNFLLVYGLHNFVTHNSSLGRHTFTIHGTNCPKMISHAKALISGNYGPAAEIQVA